MGSCGNLLAGGARGSGVRGQRRTLVQRAHEGELGGLLEATHLGWGRAGIQSLLPSASTDPFIHVVFCKAPGPLVWPGYR